MMASVVTTVRENVRLLNQRAILQAIHRRGQVSRSELAAELHLSPAAVTHITASLIEKGVVYEARAGTSQSVGRKPILLEINYDHAYVLGVKLSPAAVITTLTNLKAEVLASRVDELTAAQPEVALDIIQGATNALLQDALITPGTLVGIGLSLPGIIEPGTGTCRYSALLDWENVPIGDLLKNRFKLLTFVDNDVNALAAAEAWFGQGEKHQNFLVVTLGRGVGLGVVIEGTVYRGARGGAGEFGHLTLDSEGPRCTCGNRGCLEAYLADEALLRWAGDRVPALADGNADALVALADAGDADARALYEEVGQLLGRGLSGLVNIFAPSLIVLSGEGMRAAQHFLPATRDALKAHSFGDLFEHAELVVDSWGDDAWARGAAGLAASQYLLEIAAVSGGES